MIIEFNKNNKLDSYTSDILFIEELYRDLDNNPFGRYLLFVENNEIIGYLYYSDIYDRIEINQIEVKSIHRKSGKATQLMHKLIDNTNKSITLEVNKNNIPALNLYKKFNFNEVAIRQGYYNGIDGILMERKKDTDVE